MNTSFDIAVIGAGLSGLLAAIALAGDEPGAGRRVALIDAGKIGRETDDGRATALAPSSVRMMQRLGVALPGMTDMVGMRVGEGDADSPWQFELPARGDQPLAHVVANAALRHALLSALPDAVSRIENTTVESLNVDGTAELRLSDGRTISAALVIACDGRNSAVRRLSGLSVNRTDFAQSALVATVHHAEPHDGIALQRFAHVGAVASLPLGDANGAHRSQVIWSDRTQAVAAATALPTSTLAALINERLWSYLDVTHIEPGVQSYPLVGARAESLTAPRVALVGDAARVIHPLAGQGWNLAVRDIAALVDGVRSASQTGQDIGVAGLLDYSRWRRTDETLLSAVTSGLSAIPKRFGPIPLGRFGRAVGHVRRAAFAATDSVTALHPFLRQEAAGESGNCAELLT